MKLRKFFVMMLLGTLLALAYVQLQVQIFALAYQGKHKEKMITKLREDNGDLQSNICLLQSSNHLGLRLLDENSSLQFLSPDQIVRLPTSHRPDYANSLSSRTVQGVEKKPNFFTSLFSIKSQAEAVPIR